MQNEQTPAAGPLTAESLLPCPFCGSELSVETTDIDNFIGHVECGGCDMRGPISEWKYEDPEEAKADAVERWNAGFNRRPHVPSPASSSSVVQGDASGVEREALAVRFHETYERLAPSFGYETRDETKSFDPTTPNGRLMIAVCGELLSTFRPQPSGETREELADFLKEWMRTSEADRLQCADAILALIRPAPVASSDQPEQGGGMEVKAWLYSTVSGEGKALVKPLQCFDGKQVLGIPLTPAEPAEARVRELEAEVQRWFSAYSIAHDQATENGCRATAAEARNAKAKEALERTLKGHRASLYPAEFEYVRQTLAALQQAREVG